MIVNIWLQEVLHILQVDNFFCCKHVICHEMWGPSQYTIWCPPPPPFFQQCKITVTFGFRRRRHSWERTALKSWGRWRQGTTILCVVPPPPSAKKWRNPEVFLFLFFPKKGSAGLNSLFFKKWTPVHKCCTIAGARHHQSGWTFRDKYLRRRRQFHICDTTFS